MFEKYGQVKVRRLVADFYDNVLRSPRLSPYFNGTDIQGLVGHQTAFMRAVMGGPDAYAAGEIEHAHKHLRITEEDFTEMIRLLVRSLESHHVEPGDIEKIQGRYQEYQDAVVGSGDE